DTLWELELLLQSVLEFRAPARSDALVRDVGVMRSVASMPDVPCVHPQRRPADPAVGEARGGGEQCGTLDWKGTAQSSSMAHGSPPSCSPYSGVHTSVCTFWFCCCRCRHGAIASMSS